MKAERHCCINSDVGHILFILFSSNQSGDCVFMCALKRSSVLEQVIFEPCWSLSKFGFNQIPSQIQHSCDNDLTFKSHVLITVPCKSQIHK